MWENPRTMVYGRACLVCRSACPWPLLLASRLGMDWATGQATYDTQRNQACPHRFLFSDHAKYPQSASTACSLLFLLTTGALKYVLPATYCCLPMYPNGHSVLGASCQPTTTPRGKQLPARPHLHRARPCLEAGHTWTHYLSICTLSPTVALCPWGMLPTGVAASCLKVETLWPNSLPLPTKPGAHNCSPPTLPHPIVSEAMAQEWCSLHREHQCWPSRPANIPPPQEYPSTALQMWVLNVSQLSLSST